MKDLFNIIKIELKKTFNRPIYRVDVLRYAKHKSESFTGLCTCLNFSVRKLLDFDRFFKVSDVFPLFDRSFVILFNANVDGMFWWKPGKWDTGRMDFLDYLIKQYEDDKEDLRVLKNK